MSKAICAAWDCERPARAKGWCFKHYKRVERYGTPNVRIKGDSPTYRAVHLRLNRAKGPASAHPCEIAWCDKQAAQWAYDHSDPDPLLWKRVRPGSWGYRVFEFSADFERYMPLCRSHHHRLDRALHCSYE